MVTKGMPPVTSHNTKVQRQDLGRTCQVWGGSKVNCNGLKHLFFGVKNSSLFPFEQEHYKKIKKKKTHTKDNTTQIRQQNYKQETAKKQQGLISTASWWQGNLHGEYKNISHLTDI